MNVTDYTFAHDVVKAWFNAKPDDVKRILIERKNKWAWLPGTNVRAKTEAYSETGKHEAIFYDVVYKLQQPYKNHPVDMRMSLVFIEIKTGRFGTNWVEQMVKQWHGRTSVKMNMDNFEGAVPSYDITNLIWVVPGGEVTVLKNEMLASKSIGGSRYFIHVVPLDWFTPNIISDIENAKERMKEITK